MFLLTLNIFHTFFLVFFLVDFEQTKLLARQIVNLTKETDKNIPALEN